MLQRIQTIFLLLACSAMLIACATTLGSFTYDGDRMVVEAVGVYLNGELHHFTWGLMGLGVISAILSFVSIFFSEKGSCKSGYRCSVSASWSPFTYISAISFISLPLRQPTVC